MAARVLRPEGKGFIFLDAHPAGCARIIEEMIAELPGPPAAVRSPAALVIGCSAGYGLAAAVTGLFGYRARVVGVCYERPATQRRSASAGWYRTCALADLARRAGHEFWPVNGDCFDPAVRGQVLDRLAGTLGPIDILVYSVAAPRRGDPRTGTVYHSAVKPIGEAYRARTLTFGDDAGPVLRELSLEPASEAEIDETVKVMGGEDWADWVTELADRGLVTRGFTAVALSYVGSKLTAPIYRLGTIGRAKDDLEATAARLTSGPLAASAGKALTSVNCATVTLSSVAIPGISLYLSLLHEVAGQRAESPVRQSARLWDYLTGRSGPALDERGRLRLDDWELADEVQDQLRGRWLAPDAELISGIADPGWFSQQISRLYGFGVDGVDYSVPVEVDWPWPDRS